MKIKNLIRSYWLVIAKSLRRSNPVEIASQSLAMTLLPKQFFNVHEYSLFGRGRARCKVRTVKSFQDIHVVELTISGLPLLLLEIHTELTELLRMVCKHFFCHTSFYCNGHTNAIRIAENTHYIKAIRSYQEGMRKIVHPRIYLKLRHILIQKSRVRSIIKRLSRLSQIEMSVLF